MEEGPASDVWGSLTCMCWAEQGSISSHMARGSAECRERRVLTGTDCKVLTHHSEALTC